ncbi:MAG: uroporphyrinogen-III C-methyltransferase [Rhizobiaceae bacterium]
MSGFVSFVGSGPGDPELLTLKAVDRLKNADAVLFDDLSSGGILEFANPSADLVGVGKRAGQKSPKQDHVSKLLVDYAKTGAQVVRLKSGDSGIFGRLEEELAELHNAKIEFEIIPGVPSACAAAAIAGIPLTRRLEARRLQFITGHDISGDLPEDFNLDALADQGAITVVYMGRRTFAKLSHLLIDRGMAADTPVLIAESVSKPEQVFKRSTLQAFSRLPDAPASGPPTLIFYGPLVEPDHD